MRAPWVHVLLVGLLPSALAAQDSTAATKVRFGAFVDAYYGYDFGRPPDHERWYTTSAVRSNEFNVNLAFVEAHLTGDRARGRLALQAGTSVQANYPTEPDLLAMIQEGTAGVRVARGVWVDGGIFASHIGAESFISRDNLTYTRSFTADYTPYYQAGAKVTWEATPVLSVQLDVVNGWGIITETNDDKAVGVRLEWQATPRLLVGYDNFVGNEQPDSLPAATRVFNEVFARLTPRDGSELVLTANFGVQDDATWYSVTLVGRHRMGPNVAVNGRVERYADPDQVIVASYGAQGFETWSASLGVDVSAGKHARWRSEARGYFGDSELYPDGDAPPQRNDFLLVTSLALTF